LKVIQQHKKLKILLVGDSCTDIYQFGKVDRISPEAPVPIFVPSYTEEKGGMADNVRNNLESLGAVVDYYSGYAGTKTRLIDERTGHQIARIDSDEQAVTPNIVLENDWDAIVVSDYNKGTVDYSLIDKLRSLQIPTFVDTKKTNLKNFKNCILKINELEYSRRTSSGETVVVTLGSRGATVIDNENSVHIESKDIGVVDVTGAGDTFLAALAIGFFEKENLLEAVDFANRAAAETVKHLGVYAPSRDDIQ